MAEYREASIRSWMRSEAAVEEAEATDEAEAMEEAVKAAKPAEEAASGTPAPTVAASEEGTLEVALERAAVGAREPPRGR